ncbi:hypothetical protein BCR36DRAFT_587040 [Piromyces finnis]|uniref:ARM repeat-containing protein n=1 Tax=Piromyces finnis TaxID=1754191 RepID=A0A1Y1UX52_9FUNG|nr:hypothetical protein BCR36DRAFT_587040 [Piromyces finnis]|eukprot:ORX42769.1 hypothetical protein BCR36DRAFT_587040 [Piromyces finnis]
MTVKRRTQKKRKTTNELEKVLSEKNPSVKDILEKLQALHNELSNIEQGSDEKDKFLSVKNSLLSPTLMMNRYKAIKIYTACCLADIFRIFAPEAPFNTNEIMDVFEFFYKQLSNLTVLNGPHFKQYFYLLESLANVKCLCLISQLKDTDDLVNNFTKTIFQTIQPEQSKNIHVCLLDILEQVIEEAEHLPTECINIILDNYKQNENIAARTLAVNLCCNQPEKLQRYVCQYINSVILSTQVKENINEFIEAHNLILLMFNLSPEVLLSVIPQLQEELTLENVVVRETATDILGKMFCDTNSSLAKMYPQVWEAWLERSKDKKSSIRIKVINYIYDILENHRELASDINNIIKERSIDPDEKVRVETMKVISKLTPKTAQYISESLFKDCIGERCRDKKHIVRLEAAKSLCRIYDMHYNVIFQEKVTDEGTSLFEKFGWIPNTILKLIYTDDKDILVMVEQLLMEYLIPEQLNNTVRVDRIINIVSSLDERGYLGFISLLNRQKTWSTFIEKFLKLCETYNGGIMDNISEIDPVKEQLNQINQSLSNHFPDPKKTYEKIRTFINLNDRRSYELIRNTYNPKLSYEKILNSYKEILKRPVLAPLVEELKILLHKVSLLIINKDVTSPLIKRIKEPLIYWRNKLYLSEWTKGFSNIGEQASQKLITYITENMPVLYEDNIKLLSNLKDNDLVTNTLEALAQIVKLNPNKLPKDDKDITQQLYTISVNGTPEQAKHSTYLLTYVDNKDEILKKLIKNLSDEISVDSVNIVTRLTSLSVLAKYANALFEENDNGTKLVSFIIKDVLLKNKNSTFDEDQDDWVEYTNVDDECKIKCTGLKLMLKRIVAAKDTPELAYTLAQPFIKLCRRLITNEGEIVPTNNTSIIQRYHLRLKAGQCLLSLAKHPVFETMITMNDYLSLTLIIQDPCAEIRESFSKKLLFLIYNRKIHIRYLPILFLVAHEPEKDLRDTIKNSIIRLTKSLKKNKSTVALMETLFLHFVHILAHHSDINNYFNDMITLEQKFEILNIFSKYLEFYGDIVISRENISFIFYLAAQIKIYRDIYSKTSREIYLISDLAQYIIREKYVSADWALLTYPGTFDKFPKSLYSKLAADEGEKNVSQLYIPSEYIEKEKNEKEKNLAHSRKRTGSHKRSKSKASSVNEDVDDMETSKKSSVSSRGRRSRTVSKSEEIVEEEEDEEEDNENEEKSNEKEDKTDTTESDTKEEEKERNTDDADNAETDNDVDNKNKSSTVSAMDEDEDATTENLSIKEDDISTEEVSAPTSPTSTTKTKKRKRKENLSSPAISTRITRSKSRKL